MEINSDVVERAHNSVESMLKDAVQASKTADEFRANMAYCQIVATRMLAVLIYNSSVQSGKESPELIDKVLTGVRRELEEILEAAKLQALDSVEVQFGQPSAGQPVDEVPGEAKFDA